MSRASPDMLGLAKRLKAFETPGDTSAHADNPTVFLVVDKLRPHLSVLMGRGGFRALLARALVLASVEVPWLTTVRVGENEQLEGLTAQTSLKPDDFSETEIVLLAQLLGLLVAFIGLALTLRLINQIWPQLSFNDADFSSTANNEEA